MTYKNLRIRRSRKEVVFFGPGYRYGVFPFIVTSDGKYLRTIRPGTLFKLRRIGEITRRSYEFNRAYRLDPEDYDILDYAADNPSQIKQGLGLELKREKYNDVSTRIRRFPEFLKGERMIRLLYGDVDSKDLPKPYDRHDVAYMVRDADSLKGQLERLAESRYPEIRKKALRLLAKG